MLAATFVTQPGVLLRPGLLGGRGSTWRQTTVLVPLGHSSGVQTQTPSRPAWLGDGAGVSSC